MKRMTEKFDHTEKEAVELKEKQLEQVAGGAGPDKSGFDPSSLLEEPKNTEAGEGLQQDEE